MKIRILLPLLLASCAYLRWIGWSVGGATTGPQPQSPTEPVAATATVEPLPVSFAKFEAATAAASTAAASVPASTDPCGPNPRRCITTLTITAAPADARSLEGTVLHIGRTGWAAFSASCTFAAGQCVAPIDTPRNLVGNYVFTFHNDDYSINGAQGLLRVGVQ